MIAMSPGATRTEFFDVTGADAAVGRFKSPAQVVALTLRKLDRDDVPPSVVSGRANAFSAWAAGVMPRRLTLAVSGRVLK
ncbi:short-subunit dehydrogenase [Microbacterium trichothecenolyticum]|uniref:hypothetical protein n=1 Tax=Microbacterium trichothecenolyticum TaxID=69370 RepID=UPI002857B35C|nr:hypothetical protein [Microbacterium trichothecenolyticum]MDR7110170.1 short-subunit dehydrogenase [Microbacterium trichothecenolyticum]